MGLDAKLTFPREIRFLRLNLFLIYDLARSDLIVLHQGRINKIRQSKIASANLSNVESIILSEKRWTLANCGFYSISFRKTLAPSGVA